MSAVPDYVHWLAGILLFGAVLLLLRRMERLVAEQGSIFRQTHPGEFYLFPLLYGFLVLGFSVACWLVGVRLYPFIAVGIALLSYGLGFESLLVCLQGGKIHDLDEPAALEPRAGGACSTSCNRVVGVQR